MIILSVSGVMREMEMRNKPSQKEDEHLNWKILADKPAFTLTAGFVTNEV